MKRPYRVEVEGMRARCYADKDAAIRAADWLVKGWRSWSRVLGPDGGLVASFGGVSDRGPDERKAEYCAELARFSNSRPEDFREVV